MKVNKYESLYWKDITSDDQLYIRDYIMMWLEADEPIPIISIKNFAKLLERSSGCYCENCTNIND